MESPSSEEVLPPKLSGAEIREAFLQYYESQVGPVAIPALCPQPRAAGLVMQIAGQLQLCRGLSGGHLAHCQLVILS